jgi:hypothetical protein
MPELQAAGDSLQLHFAYSPFVGIFKTLGLEEPTN